MLDIDPSIKPDPWRAGDERLERPLQMHVLPTRSLCSTNLVISNAVHCILRNVHSADGWQDVLDPVVARYRGKV